MTTATITIGKQQYVLIYGVYDIVLHNVASGASYTMAKDEGGFPLDCTCPAWYMSAKDSPVRTCKHMKAAQDWRLETMCENILEGRKCDSYSPALER